MNQSNPYQAPLSNIEKKVPPGEAGGSLQGGINGEYDFNIGDVISEAWKKTNGMKGAFWGAAIIVLLVVFAITFALQFIFGVSGAQHNEAGTLSQMIVQLLLTAIAYPLMAGILMLGIRRSVDLPVSFGQAFSYFGFAGPVIVAAFLMTLLGYMLLVLPGIYLAMAYALTIPLIVEKRLSPWQAMEASRRAVTHHWFKIFFLMLLMGLIFIVSIIPFGLGVIWTYPMMINVLGILYRDIFGVEEVRAAP